MNPSPRLPGLYWAAAAFVIATGIHAAHRALDAIAQAACPCCDDQP